MSTKLSARCMELRKEIENGAKDGTLTELDLFQLERCAGFYAKQVAAKGLAKAGLRPGSAVEFTAKGGLVIHGVLQRMNQKTASVTCADFTQWRVSPALLRPSSKAPASTGGLP